LLIDAFCGVGFFAKTLVDKFERIVGIDWDRFAIAAAQENASEKETYIAGDVAGELRRVLEQMSDVEAAVPAAGVGQRAGDTPATTLIVDPPAIGLSAQLRQSIVDLAPATLIYVSCNPATLARDLTDLQHRFKIESVTPLDMFPQTSEIEVVAQLQRFNASAI
jgi:23S rRNA (uracil1939-C5)-methyltransferase